MRPFNTVIRSTIEVTEFWCVVECLLGKSRGNREVHEGRLYDACVLYLHIYHPLFLDFTAWLYKNQ